MTEAKSAHEVAVSHGLDTQAALADAGAFAKSRDTVEKLTPDVAHGSLLFRRDYRSDCCVWYIPRVRFIERRFMSPRSARPARAISAATGTRAPGAEAACENPPTPGAPSRCHRCRDLPHFRLPWRRGRPRTLSSETSLMRTRASRTPTPSFRHHAAPDFASQALDDPPQTLQLPARLKRAGRTDAWAAAPCSAAVRVRPDPTVTRHHAAIPWSTCTTRGRSTPSRLWRSASA